MNYAIFAYICLMSIDKMKVEIMYLYTFHDSCMILELGLAKRFTTTSPKEQFFPARQEPPLSPKKYIRLSGGVRAQGARGQDLLLVVATFLRLGRTLN